ISGATSATYDQGTLTADAQYRRVATSTLNSVACTATSNVVTVTVNNLTAGSITGSQTICDGGDPAAFTSVASTGDGTITYQWQLNTNIATPNWSNISGATSATYDAGVLNADAQYRRVATSTLNSVACTATSNVLTVTVNNMTAGSIAGDQTICANGDPAAFTSVAATGDGTITYQWQANTNIGGTPEWGNITGATSATYDESPRIGDVQYRRVATSTLNGIACTATSNVVTVTVNNLTAGSIAPSPTICENGDPAAFTSNMATGDGTITYQWQLNTNIATPSWSNISGATSETFDAGPLAADAQYRRVATSTLNSVACTATSNVLTVTVNNMTAGSISGNQTICDGGDPAAFTSVAATGDGTITYQWQLNTNLATPSWSNISGATMETYDAGVLNADAQYRRVATSTLNSVACTLISNVVTVTVNNLTAGSIAANQTICENGDPAAFTSVAATGDGTITYQWQLNTNIATPNWSNISGATSATYDQGTLTADAQYRRVATSTLNSVACTATSNVVTVTVNNLTAGSISANQTICDGGDPAAFTSVAATGDGTITYQWQLNTNIATPSWSDIGGATLATYDAGVLNADAQYRRVATSTLNSVACTATSNVVTVTVNNMTAGSIAADQTICDGGDPAAFTSVAATGDGTITYQWQLNTNLATPSWSNISGATSATYDAGVLNADAQYRRVATSTLNSVACTLISNVVTVTVNNLTAGSIAANQTICDGGDPAAFTSVAATGDGTITYQWQLNTNIATPSWSDIGGATSATYDAGVLNADAQYRRVATSTLNSIACTATSNVVTVTVNNMTAGSIAADQTICDGGDPAAFTSVAATGDGTITYQWQLNTNIATPSWSNISGATSATYDAGVLNADAQYRRVATSTLNSVACTLISNVVTVTVNNMTAGSISGTQTICYAGDPAAFTSVAATGDGTVTYQWESSTDNVNFTAIPSATSATYDVPSGLIITTYYRRVATSTLNSVACTATSNTLTVTVPTAGLSATVTSTNVKCFDAGDGTITVSSPVGGYGTYETSINGTTWFAVAAGAPYTFTGLVPNTYQVTMRDKTVTDCFILSNVTITQPTLLTVTATPSSTSTVRNGIPGATNGSTVGGAGLIKVRSGENFKLSALAAGGTIGTGYVYEWTTNAATAPTDADGSAAVYEVTNAVAANTGTYNIKVTDANLCTTNVNIVVTVYDNTVWVDASAAGNDDNAGTSDAPLKTIQKGIDATGDADAINVRTGTYDESPVLVGPRTITGTGSPALGSNRYFIYDVASVPADTITGFTTATFDNVGGKTVAGIQKAMNRVNAGGTVRVQDGTYTFASSLNVYSNITFAGPEQSMTGTCVLSPTATIQATATGVTLFKFYGTGTKGLQDLVLKTGDETTGRYMEIVAGSSGNVNTERVVFQTPNKTLYGLQNTDRSVGTLNDIAQRVNDGRDFGFGSGTVRYGKYGSLPYADLAAAWKAEDVETVTNAASVQYMYAYQSTITLGNGSFSSTRPKHHINATGYLNNRSHLRFDGTDDFLDALNNATINGGDQKTLFIAFRTGAATTKDMVVYKHGDEIDGVSVVVTDEEEIELNIYDNNEHVSLVYPAATNTNYIAQMYFNGTSPAGNSTTNPRVGMAIDDASQQVDEEKFDDAAFPITTLTTPPLTTTAERTEAKVSLGARIGSAYVDGAAVNAGDVRADFFNGSVGEVIIMNTADRSIRDAVYCYLRTKYFGTNLDVENVLERDAEVIAGETPTTDSDLMAFPNPADGEFQVEAFVATAGNVRVTLHDALGREVMSLFDAVVAANATLPVSATVRDLPSGAYLVRMVDASGKAVQTPIMVRH
ncbi:MAG: T9SS type A sorting domain-containing protein, partial [Candidatus Kapabacteria bacterium]|nr:T9SS type A sorting domain-containing protein [Candidatus Kapabacteria bacterium]